MSKEYFQQWSDLNESDLNDNDFDIDFDQYEFDINSDQEESEVEENNGCCASGCMDCIGFEF